jgi:crotonobetainyl-CoA:carnitine CoA-transferase CaiB-like acyl-CoA transferase
MVGTPIKLSRARDDIFEPPPILGEHTAEVLRGYLGINEEQLEELRKKGVVG